MTFLSMYFVVFSAFRERGIGSRRRTIGVIAFVITLPLSLFSEILLTLMAAQPLDMPGLIWDWLSWKMPFIWALIVLPFSVAYFANLPLSRWYLKHCCGRKNISFSRDFRRAEGKSFFEADRTAGSIIKDLFFKSLKILYLAFPFSLIVSWHTIQVHIVWFPAMLISLSAVFFCMLFCPLFLLQDVRLSEENRGKRRVKTKEVTTRLSYLVWLIGAIVTMPKILNVLTILDLLAMAINVLSTAFCTVFVSLTMYVAIRYNHDHDIIGQQIPGMVEEVEVKKKEATSKKIEKHKEKPKAEASKTIKGAQVTPSSA